MGLWIVLDVAGLVNYLDRAEVSGFDTFEQGADLVQFVRHGGSPPISIWNEKGPLCKRAFRY